MLNLQELSPDAVERTDIPFGEWLPDMPALNNPGSVEALNVIPTEGGYIPWKGHTPDNKKKMPGTVYGAKAVIDDDDFVQIYAGGGSGVFTALQGSNTFIKVHTATISKLKLAWKFVQMGDQMVAIHPNSFPARGTVGTTAAMVLVGGNPPKAECGAQVGDFLVLGNLKDDPDDGHGSFPYRIRWGGFNNIDSPWISDPATQADFQDMAPAGGSVRAISGREYGTIFQERTISRMTYRGPPEIFDIAQVEDRRGCIARDSIVDVGAFQFGLAEDGFFVWNGTNTELIGNNKVNRYFFSRLQYGLRSKICGAADFDNGCVHWAYPTDATGQLNEIITYSYKENRWAHSQLPLEYLFDSAETNTNLDQLLEPLESYGGSFDDQSFSQGGRGRIGAFNLNHEYGLFNGVPLRSVMATADFKGPDGRRIFINGVRPLIDVASPTVTIQAAMRDQFIGEPVVYTDEVSQELDGQCPLIADARYMRFRIIVPEGTDWRHATGVEVCRKLTGKF